MKDLDNRLQEPQDEMIKEVELKADGRTIIFYSFKRSPVPSKQAGSGTRPTDNQAKSSGEHRCEPRQEHSGDPDKEKQ